jgi:hypothetical protein
MFVIFSASACPDVASRRRSRSLILYLPLRPAGCRKTIALAMEVAFNPLLFLSDWSFED